MSSMLEIFEWIGISSVGDDKYAVFENKFNLFNIQFNGAINRDRWTYNYIITEKYFKKVNKTLEEIKVEFL